MENQRAGLALSHEAVTNNAIVYVAWGSHCDSSTLPSGTFLYDGWVAAFKYDYTANTFSLLGSFTDEPQTTGKGGIWMAGSAPAIDDTTGNVYLVTGNGNFSTTTTPKHFGESILQLGPNTLPVVGAYTPNKWATLNNGGPVTLPAPASPTSVTLPNDQDLGSGAAILLKPVSQTINSTGFEVLAAGKEGVAYVLDPTLMSNGLSGADTIDPCSTSTGVQPLQCFQPIALSVSGNLVTDGSGARVPPVFWGGDASKNPPIVENFLYAAGSQDTELRYWQMNTAPNNKGTFSTSIYATGKPPAHGGGFSFPYPGGGTLLTWDDTVSNPNQNDAILWVVDSSGFSSGKAAILLAYPAFVTQNTQNNLALTSDSSNGPIANKFTVPVVVNGEVYVGGQGPSSQCTVGTVGVNCGMLVRWSE